MPLYILGPMVVVGIAGVALLIHLLGLSKPRLLRSDQEAHDAWLREFPETKIQSASVSRAQTSALIRSDIGLGVVWSIGADTTARLLTQATFTADETSLNIHLPDYGAPHLRIPLTHDEIRHWTQAISEAT